MGPLWSFLTRRKNQKTLSLLGGGAVVAIAGLWAAFVYVFPAEEGRGGVGTAGQDRNEREGWRLQHCEQRDCDRQHGELRASADNSGSKAVTRGSVLTAVALSAALIAFGQLTAVALGDKGEAGSCAIANTGSASGNMTTCNFHMPPEKVKEPIEAALKGGEAPILDRLEQVSETLGVTKSAAKNLLIVVDEDPTIPDDKLAEALTRVAGDYKRLQAQVAALNPDNPTAKAFVDQAKPEIDAGHSHALSNC